MADSKQPTNLFVRTTPKSLADTLAALNAAITAGGFTVLKEYDLKATFASKGIAFTNECRILEVCNAHHAAKVLGADMLLSTVLPCRISVFTDQGQPDRTFVSTMLPTQIISMMPHSGPAQETLSATAHQIESQLTSFIDAATRA